MMRRVTPILCILCVVIILPFLFWRPDRNSSSAQDHLVIISPHNEAIRFEFTRAFSEYYRKLTGRTVDIEWRLPGGTTEIVRFLNSEFEASFRDYWVNRMKRSWNREVLDGFANPRPRGDVDEGSAQSLGASRFRALLRITFPLIAANLFSGAILAFAFAMLEVSDSMVLAQKQIDYPIAKAIYELSNILGEGRYLASALGVWAMLFLGLTIASASRSIGARLGTLFRG